MPRQRHVPLNIHEREELDRYKRDYEEGTGDVGDWGKFLKIVSLAGLAALGVYSVAPAARREPTVWQAKCPRCGVMYLDGFHDGRRCRPGLTMGVFSDDKDARHEIQRAFACIDRFAGSTCR